MLQTGVDDLCDKLAVDRRRCCQLSWTDDNPCSLSPRAYTFLQLSWQFVATIVVPLPNFLWVQSIGRISIGKYLDHCRYLYFFTAQYVEQTRTQGHSNCRAYLASIVSRRRTGQNRNTKTRSQQYCPHKTVYSWPKEDRTNRQSCFKLDSANYAFWWRCLLTGHHWWLREQ